MSDPRIKVMAEHFAAVTGEPRAGRFEHTMATAALEAIDKAATIKTVEELDALPIESVILDCEGYPYRRVRQYPDVPSSWEGYELGEHLDVDTIDFPARVIHWGTE